MMVMTVRGTALGLRGAEGIESIALGVVCLRHWFDASVEMLGSRWLDITGIQRQVLGWM